MRTVEVDVVGVSPLLMNRLTPEQLECIRTRTKTPKSKSKDILPRDEAATKVHTDADQCPCIPSEMLLAALTAGGKFIRLDGKRQLSTERSSLVPGLLTLDALLFPIKPGTWEVDLRAGRNPNGGEAVCIVRPRFDQWQFTVPFTFDDGALSESLCRELWDLSLSRIGLGDFRPARKGPFGRSKVLCWRSNGSGV